MPIHSIKKISTIVQKQDFFSSAASEQTSPLESLNKSFLFFTRFMTNVKWTLKRRLEENPSSRRTCTWVMSACNKILLTLCRDFRLWFLSKLPSDQTTSAKALETELEAKRETEKDNLTLVCCSFIANSWELKSCGSNELSIYKVQMRGQKI